MSLREKAREVKAAGEAERGNFTPTGAPLRVYKYWASRTKNAPKNENFCHFWRVVAFWAPFMAFRNAFSAVTESLFTNVFVLGFLAVALVVALLVLGITFAQFGTGLVLALVVLYAVVGLIIGAVYADEKYKVANYKPYIDHNGGEDRSDEPQVDTVVQKVAWVTGLVSWFSYAIAAVTLRLDKETKETIGGVIVIAALLVTAAGFVWALFDVIGWWTPVAIAAFAAAVALFASGVIALGNLAQALRRRSRDKAAKRPVVVKEVSEPTEPTAPREPGKVSKFFTGIADFLILIAQVARVNKWKICPIVTIDKNA